MISVVLFFIILSSGSFFGAAVLKRRFVEFLPVTCVGIIVIMYIFGMLGSLIAGVYLIYAGTLGLIGYSLYYVIRRREFVAFLKRFFAADFVIVAVAMLLLYIGNLGMKATEWDEFSHWMDTVKSMTLLDDFGTNPASNTIFPSYPPGVSLLQYLFQKLHLLLNPSGEFSEWRTMLAYKALMVSMMAPVCRNVSYRRLLRMIAGALAFFALPQVFYASYFSSSLIDPFLGAMSGVGLAYLIIYHKERIMRVLLVSLAAFLCVLTKDAGLMFAIMMAVGCAAAELFAGKYAGKGNRLLVRIISCMIPVIALVVPRITWNLRLAQMGIPRFFHAKVPVSEVIDTVLHRNPTWQQTSWDNYFPKFFQHQMVFGPFNIVLSLFDIFLILLILTVVLLWLIRRNGSRELFRCSLIASIVSVCQLVFYLVGMEISYITQFGSYEGGGDGIYYASFERYAKVVFFGYAIVVLALYFAAECRLRGTQYVLETAGVLVLCIFVPFGMVTNYLNRSTAYDSVEFRREWDAITESLHKITKSGSAWIICQQDNGRDYYPLKYCAKPVYYQTSCWSLGNAPKYEGDYYEWDFSPETWMDKLAAEYDYVVLYDIDDYFVENYAGLFEDPGEIEARSVYRVDRERRKLIRP